MKNLTKRIRAVLDTVYDLGRIEAVWNHPKGKVLAYPHAEELMREIVDDAVKASQKKKRKEEQS